MGYILSAATTPSRIHNLINILKCNKGLRYKYFIINVCVEYRRFGKFKIPKELIQLCKSEKRIIFNIINDYGPICKYYGVFKLIPKLKLNNNDKIIILDDDILYNPYLFYELIHYKTDYNITCGSGFNYYINKRYNPVEGDAEFCEGYGGVCFNKDQFNPFIEWYVQFYMHAKFDSNDLIDKYLKASFLGDDFILSKVYDNKFAVPKSRKYINPQQYGMYDDALHNNNTFGTNMGTYKFLDDNIEILNTFKKKYILNQEIRNNYHKTKFNKKVCVFTWYDEGIKEYADITSEINQSYCDKEGFTFYKDNIRRLPDRTPHWERLPLFVELIPKYDYVIWIDADACFRNNSHKLKDIITKYEKYDIIWSYDFPYTQQINSGFIIAKCNEYTKQYFTGLVNDKDDKWFHKPNWDQNKINEFYNRNEMDIEKRSCILSHRTMQDFYDNNNDSMILHLAGQSKEQRIKKFNEIKNKILS